MVYARASSGTQSGIGDFYRTLAQVSFTTFGLWLVVVQVRWREWSAPLRRRWGAQAVAMHFALPGVMSLLNLANPDSGVLWRTSFAALAVLGGVGVVLLDRPTASGTLSRLVHWGGVALYGAVAFVALFADAVAAGLGVDPLQIEAVLLSLLLFLGMNVAFSLLFEGATPDTQGQPTVRSAADFVTALMRARSASGWANALRRLRSPLWMAGSIHGVHHQIAGGRRPHAPGGRILTPGWTGRQFSGRPSPASIRS